MRRALFGLVVVEVVGFALAGSSGCGSNKGAGFQTTEPSDPYGLDAGPTGPTFTDDAGFSGDAAEPCTQRCSSDLHSLIDCNGKILAQCPADQGCAGPNGGCLPACDAAKANKSTIGCDFYVVTPDVIPVIQGACFAAFVANTWSTPVKLEVEWDGRTLPLSDFARIPSGNGQSLQYAPLPNDELPAGQVAILFLNRFVGDAGAGGSSVPCPGGITPAVTTEDTGFHGTGYGKAFRLTSSAPIVSYDIFPFGGGQSAATSATLLLPTSAWDTNYITVNAYRKTALGPAPPWVTVVAQEDDTDVTISPLAAIIGGPAIPQSPKGQPVTYRLKRGQTLQLEQDNELTGSPIQSTKPVGVWGGATCLNVDISEGYCDSAHQQLPPVRALGHEYVGVRYRNRIDGREEAPPWRLVGAVDGTKLVYEPAPPAGAPLALSSGQLVEFRSQGPFVVRSQDAQHPFYMSAHMTGGSAYSEIGDPEFVNVVPSDQYLSSYVFFTDPTYPETDLVVIRRKGRNGFADVNLDCAGKLSGWQPVGSSGDFEFTRWDLIRHNFVKQGACDNGRHEIHSAAPFGLTIWGWGNDETGSFVTNDVSYAYPAGASVQPINSVVVPPVPR